MINNKTMELINALDKVAKQWGLKDFHQLSLQGRPDLTSFIEKVEEYYLQDKIKEIEEELKPEYLNTVFTWNQIKKAIK